jgi:hypothetical protein
MKFFSKIAAVFNTYLLVVTQTFANGEGSHAPGQEHDAATVDPLLLVGVVIAIAIGGFLLWKFVLHGPKSSSTTQSVLTDKTPSTQTQQVQPEGPKIVQPSNQPEKLEAEK